MKSRTISCGHRMAFALRLSTLAPAPRLLRAQEEMTKLKIGFIPIGIYSYFWRARDAGYFKDEKIEVELIPMAGGGQIIPALAVRCASVRHLRCARRSQCPQRRHPGGLCVVQLSRRRRTIRCMPCLTMDPDDQVRRRSRRESRSRPTSATTPTGR